MMKTIYILALDHAHAHNVALAAKLRPHEWTFLHWRRQLMGTHEPNVVVLPAARQLPHFEDIMGEMNVRGATCWSELDLMNGKVPRW